ncbi:helix-turn-helix domain-containing protein [Streptomyces sp. NPDC088387]|uniref:helix-turn-helix domain-containing protein n=1 Tax=Streptomyces sp. NPDC088387 TaxID=3365859 RepID=UPI0037FF91F4
MSMSRTTRQIVVAHLTDRGMSPTEIADELGVSRETVRRDLHNAPASAPTPADPDEAPDVAVPEPFGPQGVTLPASLDLGQDLRLLATCYKAPPEDVTRHLLRREAEAIRDRMRARKHATTQDA